MRRRLAAWAALIGVALAAMGSARADDQANRWWEEDIWQQPERGFHWYPPAERRKSRPERPPEGKEDKTSRRPKPLTEIKDIEELRAEVKRRLEVAVMEPTAQNMDAYLEANTFLMRKSALFADEWRRAVWRNPEFDYNVVNPVANFAQVELKRTRREQEQRTVGVLARDYGLIVFVRADCPFCRLQAPVLEHLQATTGMQALVVSLDGRPVPEYPGALPDNGSSRVVTEGRGVQAVPSLFLVSRDRRQAVFLGAGVMSADEIMMRAHVLTQVAVGEDIGGGRR